MNNELKTDAHLLQTTVIASTDGLSKYPENYLCYAEIIDMIDASESLKELEVLINRKFKK